MGSVGEMVYDKCDVDAVYIDIKDHQVHHFKDEGRREGRMWMWGR